MTVLIVDSDARRRNDLARRLAVRGHVVLAAADVAEAESLAEVVRVAVAVCGTDLCLFAPAGLKTVWLHDALDVAAIVRIVERLQLSRPKSELSTT